MLGRDGKMGWLRPAGSGLVSESTAYWPHGHTTPWPPPQRGGELPGRLPSLFKEGWGCAFTCPFGTSQTPDNGVCAIRRFENCRNKARMSMKTKEEGKRPKAGADLAFECLRCAEGAGRSGCLVSLDLSLRDIAEPRQRGLRHPSI